VTAAEISAVRRVDDDVTECRRCRDPIGRGRRVAFVVGVGNVCLHCLLPGQAGDAVSSRGRTGDETAQADDGRQADDTTEE
jgi:hypothetical protein